MDEKFNAAVQRIRAEIPARNHTLWSDPNCPYPDLHDVESEGEQDDESEAMEEARGGADHQTECNVHEQTNAPWQSTVHGQTDAPWHVKSMSKQTLHGT